MSKKRKVVLVTGGGSGLGREACLSLAAKGFCVGAADLDIEKANQTAQDIFHNRGEAIAIPVDLSDKYLVDSMFDKLISHYGGIQYLLLTNPDHPGTDFINISFDEWNRSMQRNIDGAFLCCQRAVKEMIQQGTEYNSCSILFGLTELSCSQSADQAVQCTSDWALHGLMRSLALNLAKHNITVNAVAPKMEEPFIQEAASVAGFLFSDEARSITGTTIMDNDGSIML